MKICNCNKCILERGVNPNDYQATVIPEIRNKIIKTFNEFRVTDLAGQQVQAVSDSTPNPKKWRSTDKKRPNDSNTEGETVAKKLKRQEDKQYNTCSQCRAKLNSFVYQCKKCKLCLLCGICFKKFENLRTGGCQHSFLKFGKFLLKRFLL